MAETKTGFWKRTGQHVHSNIVSNLVSAAFAASATGVSAFCLTYLPKADNSAIAVHQDSTSVVVASLDPNKNGKEVGAKAVEDITPPYPNTGYSEIDFSRLSASFLQPSVKVLPEITDTLGRPARVAGQIIINPYVEYVR